MNITTKQLLVLDFIKKFIADHGYSPTVREICAGLNLKSPSTVHEHLKKLVNSGIIMVNPTKSRTIELLVENEYLNESDEIVKVPLITEEYLNYFSKEFISIPKFMLNDYNPKNIKAYKTHKKIYIINELLKPKDDNLVLIYDTILEVCEYKNQELDKILGTVISTFEIL